MGVLFCLGLLDVLEVSRVRGRSGLLLGGIGIKIRRVVF